MVGIKNTWNNVIDNFGDAGFVLAFVISILVFFALYCYLIQVLRKNNATSVIFYLVLCVIVAGIIFLLDENLDGVFFLLIPIAFTLIVINLFSIEIKRSIWSRNRHHGTENKKSDTDFDEEEVNKAVDEIVKALQDMAKNDIGALIVLSSRNIPAQILDSGVKLKSDISSELIESVFFPKTPLHDGAMIINGTQIIAAGCFLPLSQDIDNIAKDLGTRHRAGMGITENIDVISLIVSEETGIISIAKGGHLTRFADTQMLKNTLNEYYWQDIGGGKNNEK